ncbi:MAG: hypothetical protein HKO13_07315 [Sphingomonas sp.]|nr:hypothetical protein [Sphingomonas sp.]
MTDSRSALSKLRIAGWAIVGLLLLLPVAAMRLQVDGVDWGTEDFIVAFVLLVGSGLLIEGLVRVSHNPAYRLGAALAVLTTLFMIWSNLAVGIVGSENDPFNSFYFLLLPLIALGALIVRLRARGMAAVMALAAIFPVGMAIAALALRKHLQPMGSVTEIVGVNSLFVLLYGLSALLFWKTARRPVP